MFIKKQSHLKLLLLLTLSLVYACKMEPKKEVKETNPVKDTIAIQNTADKAMSTTEKPLWEPYDDAAQVAANAQHQKEKMRYQFIQSKVLDKNEVFDPLYKAVAQFSAAQYQKMKPLVLEQSIPAIQQSITQGVFTYEDLVLFYLYRIYKYELPNTTTLNTVLALNPKVLEEARALDSNAAGKHPIYGMPILLKDNIGAANMNTTAGAIALKDNRTADAFIVARLKEKGALILGKVNLSEWANFICDCPNGQSAVGGQTLNPYGRMLFDTGGSSAGSGTAVAANYAVGAVGTETSGSILSPSGQNSVVGMKPTVGLLSRTGIVPISSTLDTPGPMTKNVVDNGILLDAMRGFDEQDDKSVQANWAADWYAQNGLSLKGKRLGALKNYVAQDSIYRSVLDKLRAAGAVIVVFEPPEVTFNGFLSILTIDMKADLPKYLASQVLDKEAVTITNVAELVAFNLQDASLRMPYGQIHLEGILADTTSAAGLATIKKRLQQNGRLYFNQPMAAHRLDAVLSINNYDAGVAAAAAYPALTVPMGYRASGEPVNLTFIGKQYQEGKLYALGSAFEALVAARKIPAAYQE